jgi:hypothetical protein
MDATLSTSGCVFAGSVGAVALNTPKPGNVVAARDVVAVCFK